MTNYLQLAEKSLKYLQDSEEDYGRLKALVKYAPERIKAQVAQLILDPDNPESSQAGKKAWAEAHKDHEHIVDSFETVSNELFVIQEKRVRAETTIEFWRSHNAAQKLGNPT